MRHFPTRVEALLERLWHLPEGDGNLGEFMAGTLELVSGAEGEGLVIFVTGGHEEAGPIDLPAVRDDVRIVVLQFGADEVAPEVRRLAVDTGGVVLALPASASPELAVLDFLAHLRVPALTSASIDIEGARVLRGPGDFANQPVLFVVPVDAGGGKITGVVSGDAWGQAMAREFSLRADAPAEASDALVRELLDGVPVH